MTDARCQPQCTSPVAETRPLTYRVLGAWLRWCSGAARFKIGAPPKLCKNFRVASRRLRSASTTAGSTHCSPSPAPTAGRRRQPPRPDPAHYEDDPRGLREARATYSDALAHTHFTAANGYGIASP